MNGTHRAASTRLGKSRRIEDYAKASILVVEDSVTVREVERHVESAGYEVVTAVDGKDGLNQAKRSHSPDHHRHRYPYGWHRNDWLTASPREIQRGSIVVVSYKDRDEDRSKAMDAGASYYVTKSEFDSGEMLNLISDLLRNLG